MIYNTPVFCNSCKEDFKWHIYNVSPEYGYIKCKCQRHPIIYSIPVFTKIPYKDQLIKLIVKRKFTKALAIILSYSSARSTENLGIRLSKRLGNYSCIDKQIKLMTRENIHNLKKELQVLCTEKEAIYFAYRFSSSSFISPMALFSLVDKGPIIDIGCGLGHMERVLSRNTDALRITGIDIRFHFLYLAKKYIAPDANFICIDVGNTFPLRTGAFQHTLLSATFNHVPANTVVAEEIIRITAKEGKILNAWINLKQNYLGDAPLSRDEYKKMFPDSRLFDARKITKEFLVDRKIDLTTEAGEQSEIISIVKAPQDFFKTYTLDKWPFKLNELYHVNPVYDETPMVDKVLLKRKELPENCMEQLLIELGCLPRQLEITHDELLNPHDELLFKLVLADLPRS